jgi:cell wall-associated protease
MYVKLKVHKWESIMKNLLMTGVLLTSLSGICSTIAVIDSGVDVEHRDFISNDNIWMNPLETVRNGRDEDNNGYQDDIYGWNFAENNNLVIDRKYIGTFSENPKKFFDIQGRMLLGTATQADLEWVKKAREDKEIMAELAKFGNFVHGTHVAGITVADNNSKILSVKLIPTEVKPFIDGLMLQKFAVAGERRMKLVKSALTALAGQQMQLLEEIFYYVGQHGSRVANGSFGTGFTQAKAIATLAFKAVFWRAPSEDELNEVAGFFINELVKEGEKAVAKAPKTLFVFAAGNDGSDNDKFPTSPTNIQADNEISVAATYKDQMIASFSNYGTKTVDIAAPGMLINSQIPGNDYLVVSGTSQAAPYVSNVAAKMFDANPKLTPKDVKKIMMNTVDKMGFLSGKVKSGGLVNLTRAVTAAELTNTMSIDAAIGEANATVSRAKFMGAPLHSKDVIPMAMPSQFRF